MSAESTLARVLMIRCNACNNPIAEGSGNCVSDAGRPHVHAARSGPGFGRIRQWSTPDRDEGEGGVRVISEYGLFITQDATLQDHRYPPVTKHHSDRRPCEHYELRTI